MCQVFSSVAPNKVFDNPRQRDAYDRAFRAVQALDELVNSVDSVAGLEGFVDAFIQEHRTTQQRTVGLFCNVLCLWVNGEKGALVDGRNQAAWEFAEFLRDKYPGFPLI